MSAPEVRVGGTGTWSAGTTMETNSILFGDGAGLGRGGERGRRGRVRSLWVCEDFSAGAAWGCWEPEGFRGFVATRTGTRVALGREEGMEDRRAPGLLRCRGATAALWDGWDGDGDVVWGDGVALQENGADGLWGGEELSGGIIQDVREWSLMAVGASSDMSMVLEERTETWHMKRCDSILRM